MSLASLARMQAPRPASQADIAPGRPAGPAPGGGKPAQRDGFDSLIKYIPTETVTLFVALCSARPALAVVMGGESQMMWLYAVGVIATPLILWTIALGRHRSSGATEPFRLHPWPPIAATIAFMVWALSVPGATEMLSSEKPVQEAWGAIAALGAIIVSLVLSMLEPLFGPKPAG